MCSSVVLAFASVLSWIGTDAAVTDTTTVAPEVVVNDTIEAWRGETVSARALLTLVPSTSGTLRAEMPGADARFMSYVLTDAQRSCGAHRFDLKPWRVADIVDSGVWEAGSGQWAVPVWVRIDVAPDAEPGLHDYRLCIFNEGDSMVAEAALTVDVSERVLPPASEWAFHTDFWQQPYAVSRYYGLERWSTEHFEALKPYMRNLARAGQKVVTAILFYEPWGDQSHDKFDPMVTTTRRADGTWAFGYDIFDRYVAMMDSCGINAQINCYSMIPWDMTFRYFDESAGEYKNLKTKTATPEYDDLWGSFLTDFTAHLRQRGLLEKTRIAMDERGLQPMLDAYALVQKNAPELKIALAGNRHPELIDKLEDYSITLTQQFTPEELAERKKTGKVSTFYTCCTEAQPNLLSNNEPSDATMLPLIASARGLDGYLHWSWMNWPDAPLEDSRFRLFSAGDTYLFYPGPRTSARFERYIQGVQLAEKIRLLRASGADMTAIDAALADIAPGVIAPGTTSAELVNKVIKAINQTSRQ